MKKEIVIIGVSRFSTELIKRFKTQTGFSIIAIDENQERLKSVEKDVKACIIGDATNEEFIKSIGIDNADYFVIGMGRDFQSSLIIATILSENFNGKIIAKSINAHHKILLSKVDVYDIVTPEVTAASKTFYKITSPFLAHEYGEGDSQQVNEIFELNDKFAVVKMDVPDSWDKKKVLDLKIPKDIKILFTSSKQKMVSEIVSGNTILNKKSSIWVLGEIKDLTKFAKIS